MRRSFALLVLAWLACAAPACRKETIDKPSAPEMAEVLAVFEQPTGTFDAATIAAVRAQTDEAIQGLVGAGLPQQLVDDVRQALDDLSKGQSTPKSFELKVADTDDERAPVRPMSLEGEGFGRITRICPGWGAEPAPDLPANGALQVTATFTDFVLDPVVWGTTERCHVKVASSRILVDRGDEPTAADLRIHLGGPVKVETFGTLPIVVAIRARAQIDDKPVRGDLAVRIVPSQSAIELAVDVGNGTVIASIADAKVAGVRAKNGTFSCDAVGCTSGSGEVLAW